MRLARPLPFQRGRGRGDGDAALAFLRHPVHLRFTIVNLADLVDAAGVIQEALGDRGLARVDVGHDADVADARQPGQLAGFGDWAWRFVGHGSADYRKSTGGRRQATDLCQPAKVSGRSGRFSRTMPTMPGSRAGRLLSLHRPGSR